MPGGVGSYHIYEVTALAITEPVSIPHQLELLADSDLEVADSRIYPISGEPLPPGVASYRIQHEMVVNQIGRAKGIQFSHYITPTEFDAYYKPDSCLIALHGRAEVTEDFVKTWQRSGQAVIGSITPYEVNFGKLEPHLEVIRGAWFRFHDPRLSSSGHFGYHVDQSPEYQSAKAVGTLTVLNFLHAYEGLSIPVMVTRKCTIVIQKAIETLELELAIVFDVYHFLNAHGCITKVERRARRSRRTSPNGEAVQDSGKESPLPLIEAIEEIGKSD
jgi:hypothetical protein